MTDFEKILQVIDRKGVTKTKAEQLCGFGGGTITKLGTRKGGKGKLHPDNSKKFIEVFGVNPEWWRTEKGDMFIENLTPEPKLEQGNNYDLSHMNTAIQSLLMTIDSMKQDIKRLEREVEQLKLAGKRNE